MGPYRITYLPQVVKKDIPKLSAPIAKQIKRAIEERITVDPMTFGKPLRYSRQGQYRLRIGNYRIIYVIDRDAGEVTITAIKHRSDVYD